MAEEKKSSLALAKAFVSGHPGVWFLNQHPTVGLSEVIPCRNIAVDYGVLGIGGLPCGRIIEIFGPTAGGKTTLAEMFVASAQKMGFEALYCDAEHALNPEHAEQVGVDTERLVINQPDCGEDALNLCVEGAESGAFKIIVVDSVANLVPKAELDGEIGDDRPGAQAKMMARAMRRLTHAVSQSQTCMVFLNQERAKFGAQSFMPTTTTTGGMSLPYYASIRLDVTKIAPIKQGEEQIGQRVKIQAVKNKLYPPFRKADVDMIYGLGYANEPAVLDMACDLGAGITKKNAAWFYMGDQIGHSRPTAISWLRENPAAVAELETQVKMLMGYEVTVEAE